MKVELINYTPNAMDLLIYTKSTRLTQGAETRAKIAALTEDEKLMEIHYMSRTLPSSWEFCDFVFEIQGVTRAFTHQLVRTRTGSYAQQAQRIVDMSQDFQVLVPERFDAEQEAIYKATCEQIKAAYAALIIKGAKAEDARGLLPTNIKTNIIAKFNLRTLSDMVKKRMKNPRVQGEYREVVGLMTSEVLRVYPWTKVFLFPDDKSFYKALEFIDKFKAQDEALAIEATKDINLAQQF